MHGIRPLSDSRQPLFRTEKSAQAHKTVSCPKHKTQTPSPSGIRNRKYHIDPAAFDIFRSTYILLHVLTSNDMKKMK